MIWFICFFFFLRIQLPQRYQNKNSKLVGIHCHQNKHCIYCTAISQNGLLVACISKGSVVNSSSSLVFSSSSCHACEMVSTQKSRFPTKKARMLGSTALLFVSSLHLRFLHYMIRGSFDLPPIYITSSLLSDWFKASVFWYICSKW